jgi:hypothetical protein
MILIQYGHLDIDDIFGEFVFRNGIKQYLIEKEKRYIMFDFIMAYLE